MIESLTADDCQSMLFCVIIIIIFDVLGYKMQKTRLLSTGTIIFDTCLSALGEIIRCDFTEPRMLSLREFYCILSAVPVTIIIQ